MLYDVFINGTLTITRVEAEVAAAIATALRGRKTRSGAMLLTIQESPHD